MKATGPLITIIFPALLLASGALAQSNGGCTTACTQNGGKCAQEFNSPAYFCDCTGTGRQGTDCASISSNASSPATSTSSGTSTCPVACTSNGQCMQQYNSDSYYCLCKPGFTGASCGATSAPAASPPAATNMTASNETVTCPVECVNGQCLQEYNSDSYYCLCTSGFSGASCKTGAAPAPATANSTTATTTPGGTFNCPVPCKNGQCLPQFNSDSYYCNCTAGFSGVDCSGGSAATAATSPAAAIPAGCKNCQRGSCKPVYNSLEYYCDCPSGYTGWDCGITTGSSANGATSSGGSQQHGARTLEGWKIFVIVLAAVAGSVMAAGVAYIVWKQRRTPATFVKFNDADAEGQQEIEIKRYPST